MNKILSYAIFLLAISANANELTVNPNYPKSYTVVKGDTLWDISARFLDQPWRWPEIWNVNPQIENPHLIYPGDVVSLKHKDGQPVLYVNRAGQVVSDRNVKLSPTVRSYGNDDAIPTIPIDAIQQFLKQPIVLDENEMDQWPYIVSSYNEHLIATTGNTIYVRGIAKDSDVTQYSIYRKGEVYINSGKDRYGEDEILGYEAIYIGDATLTKKGDTASAVVTRIDQEILIGDRLIPQSDEDISTEFLPSATPRKVKGNILSVVDGVSQISQYQIVAVNLGEKDGIEVGNVLGVYQSAYSKDITLPEEYVGVVMVFRTFNKVSYALVMETQGPMHVSDTVRNL